jgi:7,8-dihydro-6-hydroxymethylpterin dimethyltransferase
MKNQLLHWTRFFHNHTPIYINGNKPDWMVLSKKADYLVRQCLELNDLNEAMFKTAEKFGLASNEIMLMAKRLAAAFSFSDSPVYQGRGQILELDELQECWFHLTNKCNLSCSHCLFSCSARKNGEINPEVLRSSVKEARKLGCRVFYFTGGEPLVYPDFFPFLAELLSDEDVHAIVLTNALLIKDHLEDLKKIPLDRLNLQISIDGTKNTHDKIRGKGAFDLLIENLELLKEIKISKTLAMAVNKNNLSEMAYPVKIAEQFQAQAVHYLWHFSTGRGSKNKLMVPVGEIIKGLKQAKAAGGKKIIIDNFEYLRTQVFSASGTRYDLSNSAWNSLVIGPDHNIYPSPALVGINEHNCGSLSNGLEQQWRSSRILDKFRRTSLIDSPEVLKSPFRFLTGGGDIDHSYFAGASLVGDDPYIDLYEDIVLTLISEQANLYQAKGNGEILLRMGDVRYDCNNDGREVELSHCNCVVSFAD